MQFFWKRICPQECQVFYHQQDILTFDFCALARQPEEERLVVLGNLPYNISSPLIFRLLEVRHCLKRAVLMVQKEVGERLLPAREAKIMVSSRCCSGLYARVRSLFALEPGQFYPPPDVDSLVVSQSISSTISPLEAPSFAFLRNIVNTCFQQRRKTLLNSSEKPCRTGRQRCSQRCCWQAASIRKDVLKLLALKSLSIWPGIWRPGD